MNAQDVEKFSLLATQAQAIAAEMRKTSTAPQTEYETLLNMIRRWAKSTKQPPSGSLDEVVFLQITKAKNSAKLSRTSRQKTFEFISRILRSGTTPGSDDRDRMIRFFSKLADDMAELT